MWFEDWGDGDSIVHECAPGFTKIALNLREKTDLVGLDQPRVTQINWSEELQPDKECMYTHVHGDTPFGQCVISWKGWKDNPDFEIESGVFGPYSEVYSFLEGAKAAAQHRFESLVNACIDMDVYRPVQAKGPSHAKE